MAVRGGGEMASAAARLLFLSGFPVLVLERPQPLAVRRLVCFAEAVFRGGISVEGVSGKLVPRGEAAAGMGAFIPVVIDPEAECLAELRPPVVVDGRMAKRNLGGQRGEAALVIGLGPGLVAGKDVDVVVETQRGPALGRVIWSGRAEADTAVPGRVLGYGEERVLRATRGGIFRSRAVIGDEVEAGQAVGEVGGAPVHSAISGRLRGLLADGVEVDEGVKVGDVDPRGAEVDPARISDKARTVAAGVLEAVLWWMREGRRC